MGYFRVPRYSTFRVPSQLASLGQAFGLWAFRFYGNLPRFMFECLRLWCLAEPRPGLALSVAKPGPGYSAFRVLVEWFRVHVA